LNKEEVIKFFKDDHKKLVSVIEQLDKSWITERKVTESWSVKDIIAHISAWNWDIIRQIDDILVNRKPWYVDMREDSFNMREVQKRGKWSLDKILDEWHNSFEALISRMDALSEVEWAFQAEFNWPDGSAVTIQSLFGYRYRGEGHEGGHAKQIEEHFNL
jgi:hypothetical protein